MMTPDESPVSGLDDGALLPIRADGVVDLSADDVATRLERFSRRFEGAMSASTIRAVRGDWATYATWCRAMGCPELKSISPALSGRERDDAEERALQELKAFFSDAIARGLRRATLDRYQYTIRLAHKAARIPDITQLPDWKMIWRGFVRALAKDGRNRRRQAKPLRETEIATVVEAIDASRSPTLRDLRDTALMTLASDTMARREELARVRVEHIDDHDNGTGTLEIPSSKTDQAGHGLYRHVSQATMMHVRRWLEAAGIDRGPVFRAVHLGRSMGATSRTDQVGDTNQRKPGDKTRKGPSVSARAIAPQEVARIFQRRLKEAGLDARGISGHSTRIGTTQDLIRKGYTAAAIARVAGWANGEMVSYYGRALETDDTVMADARRGNPLPAPRPTDLSLNVAVPRDIKS